MPRLVASLLLGFLLFASPSAVEARVDLTTVASEEVVQRLDQHPEDPGLLALAARQARRAGRLVDAAWFAHHALNQAQPGALALSEGRALGWEVEAGEGAPSPMPLAPAWPWWLATLLALSLMGIAAHKSRDRLGASALFVGLVAGALVMPPLALERPSLPTPLATLSEGAPCEVGAMTWRSGRLEVVARCAGEPRTLVVTPTVTGQQAIAHTLRHSVSYRGQGGSPELQLLIQHLQSALASAEASGYTVPGAVNRAPTRLERWQGADPADQASLRVSAGLVAATLWILLALGLRALRFVLAGKLPRGLWLPFVLSALVLLATPGTMRMVYGGYDLTMHLVEGLVPRYGPGALWFYGPAQWLLGADHAWLQGLNRVYGLGSLVALYALCYRWFPQVVTLRSMAWLLATLPVFFAAHTCESIHAAPALGILASLWLWADARRIHPVAATLPWLAAAITRPEMAAMALLAPGLIWALRGRPRFSMGPLVVSFLGALTLLLLILRDLLTTTEQMVSDDALTLGPEVVGKALSALLEGSIFASPTVTPTMVLGLVVACVVVRATRPIALPTVCFILLWMGLTGVDHAQVSLPRIQLVPLLLGLPLAAAALTAMRAASAPLRVLIYGLYIAGALYSATSLWAPTNEDHEEALWREAVAVLPSGPLCLATIGYGDPPDAGLSPRHHPGYLLSEGDPTRSVRHLAHLDALVATCPGPVYALLGMRCHVAMRSPGDTPPGDEGLQACREVRQGRSLEPIIERRVDNRGDLAYPMYPAATELPIGLYRVRP